MEGFSRLGKYVLCAVRSEYVPIPKYCTCVVYPDLYSMLIVRQVTGNDQDYLGESPEWLFRYLRFSKRATVGVRATYATR